MTRGPIPRFDLYEELEVSRLASEEVIDAAYRTLVKRYHPDVAGTNTASGSSAGSSAGPRTVDVDRIKRLNVAHDWLTTPAKRSRYDDSTAWEPRAVPATTPGHEPAQAVRESQGVRESQPASFGPNGAAVRQFLAYLRPLDQARGLEIGLAKASLDSTAYAEARGSALAASRRGRHDQWLLARDAATVIARGKLVESPLAREIATIVADAAGAIVVRDLISPADYRLLLAPWALPPASSAVTKPVDPRRPRLARAHALVVAGSAFRAGRRSVAVGVGGMAVLAVLAFALLGNQRPPLTAAAPTDNPTDAVAGLEVTAAPSAAPSPPAASGPGAASPQPSGSETVPTSLPGVPVQTFGPGPTPRVTLRPTLVPSPAASPTSSPVPTPVPTPDPTPVPTPVPTPDPTPVPTPVPTPDPTPVPTPVPTPSPTPAPMCTVVNLFNLWTWQAQSAWDNAGFSGTVTFSPPGTYRIKSQSLVAGTSVLCTSGITVHNT